MKSKLKIDKDLEQYLIKETYRGIDINTDFDWQWVFRFNNNYGASVVKFYR